MVRLADLRVLLVADVLTRIAELNGLQVVAVLRCGKPASRRVRPERQRAWHPPPAACVSPRKRKHRSAGQPMCTWPGARPDSAIAAMECSSASVQ